MRQFRQPEDVLGASVHCEEMLSLLISTYLAMGDEFRAEVIESTLVARLSNDEKLKVLGKIVTHEKPTIAEKDWQEARSNLSELFAFRNRIAHSRPVKRSGFERVRWRGVSQPFTVDKESLARMYAQAAHSMHFLRMAYFNLFGLIDPSRDR